MNDVVTTEELDEAGWEMLGRLTKDLRKAADHIGREEARYLVDSYYQIQKLRIALAGQVRALAIEYVESTYTKEAIEEIKEKLTPAQFLKWRDDVAATAGIAHFARWLRDTMHTMEKSCQSALGRYAKQWATGHWLQSICGIGPVISAGLLAHIDIRKCKTFGGLWRYAGMDPTCKWEKKTKRPWNADLKTLVAFKLGECFVKVQNNKSDFYGKLYRERKDEETAKNERGEFREAAARALEEKNYDKKTDAYKAYSVGRLPPAHIHARARRYAVKLFLSHLHHVMHWDYYGEAPPIPYVFEHPTDGGDHRHYIAPPNWPEQASGKGLKELLGA